LFNNSDVSGFHDDFMPVSEMEKGLQEAREAYYMNILNECFTFSELVRLVGWTGGIFNNHLKNTYPQQTEILENNRRRIRDLEDIAEKFRREMERIGCGDKEHLDERVSKAAGYFMPLLAECAAEVTPILSVSVDNNEVKKTLADASGELIPELSFRIQTMKNILESGFSIETFLQIRNDIMLSTPSELKRKQKKESKAAVEKEKKSKPDISKIYSNNRHPELIEPLIEWRTEQYMSQNIRAYWVLTQRALLEIADTCPSTKEELLAVSGFGPAKWKQYGQEILDLIAKHKK
jgi:hypothetical protein